MARTSNEQEYAEKRNHILDAAQRLVYAKGYERMTIQDILLDVQISSGAFYHYFGSKPAVLAAFIERMQHELATSLSGILNDPHLSAIRKLQGFFDTLSRLRAAHKADVVKLLRVWYSDDNAIVRQKVDDAIIEQRAPLLTAIIRQGLAEGSFTTAFPDTAGAIVLSMLQRMGHTQAGLLLAFEHDALRCTEAIVATHAAYMDALERVLGAPPDSFARANAESVSVWLAALHADGNA